MGYCRERVILHIDANNFYASVSTALHSEYAGKAIAVTGNPELRHGIILAKSQAAKAFGVATGEPIWQAKKKCPELVCIPPDYNAYVEYSDRLFSIYTEYTDKVESFGLDECWLDCTESQKLFGDGKTIADTIRARVKRELNITVSVGVSFTKIFAKLGSDYKKPDATTVIDKSNYKDIVWPLPASDMMMVGSKTAKILKSLNINTIGDIAAADEKLLCGRIGIAGKKLMEYAAGIETEDVKEYYVKSVPDSIGNGTTMPKSVIDESSITAVITGLSDMIATRLRKYGLKSSGVRLSVKFDDLTTVTKQGRLASPSNSAKRIIERCMEILPEIYDYGRPIRAISVSVYKLGNSEELQLSMFDMTALRDEKLDSVIDVLRKKYGYSIVKPGIVEAHGEICHGLVESDFIPFKKNFTGESGDLEIKGRN